jgi:hypothetical protein
MTSVLAGVMVVSMPASGEERLAQECVPACRTGFLCHRGECISACNPPCESGSICTNQGECVSACNPPCPTSHRCLDTGECAVSPAPVAAPAPMASPALGDAPVESAAAAPPAAAGWARSAAIFGIVLSVVTLGLTVAIVANEDPDFGIPAGIVATVLVASGVPVIAVGGSSARGDPRVIGLPAWRLAGWIAYGFAVLDAAVLIGLAADDARIGRGLIAGVGALGIVGVIAFTLDAFESASEAERLVESGGRATTGPRLQPFIALVPDGSGSAVTTFGLRGVLW